MMSISSLFDGEFSSRNINFDTISSSAIPFSNEFSINAFVQIRIKVEQCFIHSLVFDYIWALPLNYRAYLQKNSILIERNFQKSIPNVFNYLLNGRFATFLT